MDPDRQLSSYDYLLPDGYIAQNPAEPRDHSKLLVISDSVEHRHFYDLDKILKPGDLLVLNNTKVIPARLYGHKTTGSKVEVLLLEERSHNCWLALVKPGRKLQPGAEIHFTSNMGAVGGLSAVVSDRDDASGGRILEFTVENGQSLLEVVDDYGHMPLPPYITQSTAQDDRYQTVYAETLGAAAAPTAGLHFTPELLDRLAAKGIDRAFVTLHVGIGTFRPVETEDITQHEMHGEWIEVSSETVDKVQQTKARGGRVFAVGTTSVRSLEGAASSGFLQPYCGKTNMFIYPGYEWRVVDGLVTNFHLPKSSLMMMVSALMGRSRLLEVYAEAIKKDYRFFSFGDAMLILPEGRCDRS
ncbi:MAG: tRNA preQ1(34) S-adenosylmethionine ribosyltransferase-isomerase QueA [Alkalinema sp. CAN_BIN05]|nr:tRNA preQ1(34) S-adenosylmethionine ribosyltransferase-isomerase QueA [Alkalinema sp. CAN_BIN05]